VIERRDLFKIMTAGALAGPTAAADRPPFFSDAQRTMVDRLADIIIPTDEQSPGAHDAGVARFIDLLAVSKPSTPRPERGSARLSPHASARSRSRSWRR
jgi:hypothetical protein